MNIDFELFQLINDSCRLQLDLLALGLFSRGVIANAPLYHRGQLIIGQGLVDCYKIERKLVTYPRVIVLEDCYSQTYADNKDGLVKDLMNLSIDFDGFVFADYARWAKMNIEIREENLRTKGKDYHPVQWAYNDSSYNVERNFRRALEKLEVDVRTDLFLLLN